MTRAIEAIRTVWEELFQPQLLRDSRTEAMRRLLDKAAYEPDPRWRKAAVKTIIWTTYQSLGGRAETRRV